MTSRAGDAAPSAPRRTDGTARASDTARSPHPRWRSLAALVLASTLGYCVAPYPSRAAKKPAACPYRRTAR